MTNTKKITISKQFDLVAKFIEANGGDKAMIDFIIDRKAQHEKKIGNRKPTKVQEQNVGLIADILDFMESVGKRVTIADLIKDVPSCHGLSTPKVSALVTKLKNSGEVVRVEEKGRAYFSLADGETVEG